MMKRILKISGISLAILLAVVYFLGVGWHLVYSPSIAPLQISEPVEAYVANKEAQVQNIKVGNQAEVLRIEPNKKTSVAFVYIHGFSAGPKEISPLVEKLSSQFKANAYLARLKDHGVENSMMLNVTADDLFTDAEEAYQIGKKLGERVILVGTSTGATLALWLAQQHSDVAGLILISPNIGVYDKRGVLSSGPIGSLIARAVVGPVYSWKPKHANQGDFWTTSYHPRGISAMMNVVREVEMMNFSSIQTPSITLWTPLDKVVNIQKAVDKIKTLGSQKNEFIEFNTPEHVLAGAITASENVEPAFMALSRFVSEIVP
jgi:esterase/lipase